MAGEDVAHQIVMDSRGFGSAGNLSNCFRGSVGVRMLRA